MTPLCCRLTCSMVFPKSWSGLFHDSRVQFCHIFVLPLSHYCWCQLTARCYVLVSTDGTLSEKNIELKRLQRWSGFQAIIQGWRSGIRLGRAVINNVHFRRFCLLSNNWLMWNVVHNLPGWFCWNRLNNTFSQVILHNVVIFL